jgi:fatty-acyl-CoA synthase
MVGAKLVFPGPHLHPEDLLDLMQLEPPTLSLGVPTIWLSHDPDCTTTAQAALTRPTTGVGRCPRSMKFTWWAARRCRKA